MSASARASLGLTAGISSVPSPHLHEVLRRPIEFTQYTSLAFGRRCDLMGVRPSMGSVGDAYENAMAESFFGTLECELLDRYSFRTQAEARQALFRYIEGWYNPRRRHSSLGYLSPAKFEAKHWPGSVRATGLADFPAVAKGLVTGPGSTPLHAAEALLTQRKEGKQIRLT